MLTNRVKWAIGCVFVLALCTGLSAQMGRWEFLGEAHVDGGQDHDSIKVGKVGRRLPCHSIANQRRRH